MTPEMKEKIEKRRKELYRAMKAQHPDLYQAAVAVGHMALPIFHPAGTDEQAIAAEVECCAMQLAAKAVGLAL
jgi:phytoene/squalene synthetase